MPPAKSKGKIVERRGQTTANGSGGPLEAILKYQTFDQALRAGNILDIIAAAKKTGYSEQHLRRLCAKGKVACIVRGEQYFFLPAHIQSVFKAQTPAASPKGA